MVCLPRAGGPRLGPLVQALIPFGHVPRRHGWAPSSSVAWFWMRARARMRCRVAWGRCGQAAMTLAKSDPAEAESPPSAAHSAAPSERTCVCDPGRAVCSSPVPPTSPFRMTLPAGATNCKSAFPKPSDGSSPCPASPGGCDVVCPSHGLLSIAVAGGHTEWYAAHGVASSQGVWVAWNRVNADVSKRWSGFTRFAGVPSDLVLGLLTLPAMGVGCALFGPSQRLAS